METVEASSAAQTVQKRTRKVRAQTTEIKLEPSAPAVARKVESARTRSPARTKSRSQSRSRKSLPSKNSPSKSRSPVKTRSKRNTTNLGAKLYTKKDLNQSSEKQVSNERQRSNSPTKARNSASASPRRVSSRTSSPSKVETLSPTPSPSSNSAANTSYELRQRSSPRRVESRAASASTTRQSGAQKQQKSALCSWFSAPWRWTCPFQCPFSDAPIESGYLRFTLRHLAHLVVFTLFLIVTLFVLNRFNVLDLEFCSFLKAWYEQIARFTNNLYLQAVNKIQSLRN